MPGDMCIVCRIFCVKAPGLSYHHFPTNPAKPARWLSVFQLSGADLNPHYRVCSQHFSGGDIQNYPDVGVGKRFASPVKKGVELNISPFMEGRQQLPAN